MIPFAALLLLLAPQDAPDRTPADQRTVERLIDDLSAPDPQRRELAEEQLKKRGRSALPALREAARSDDAERALSARRLLVELVREERGKEQTPSSPAPRITVVYEDWSKGIHFALAPNGKTTLTVPEPGEDTGRRRFKTYQAGSIEEFKKKYPEIAEKYELDRILSFRETPTGDEQLRERLGLREGDQGAAEEPGGRRFGILVRPVDATLASQLRLPKGEGLVVRRVDPGSLAEKSGVKPSDVVVTVNGEKVQSRRFQEFRKRLQEAVSSKESTLEVLRGGKPEKILVTPAAGEKEEQKPKAK